MSIYVTKLSLRCDCCGDKRLVALVVKKDQELTALQICLACAVRIVDAFAQRQLRGRRKDKRREDH